MPHKCPQARTYLKTKNVSCMHKNNILELPVSWSFLKIGFSLVLQVPVHFQPRAKETLTGIPAILKWPHHAAASSAPKSLSKSTDSNREKCNKSKAKATTKEWNWFSEDRYSVSAGIFPFYRRYSEAWGWLYLDCFLVEWLFFKPSDSNLKLFTEKS